MSTAPWGTIPTDTAPKPARCLPSWLAALYFALLATSSPALAQTPAAESKEALRARAEKLAEDLLATTQAHGPADARVQKLQVELGGLLIQLGEPKKAAELLIAAEAQRAKRLSPTDESLVDVRCLIAKTRDDVGKSEKGTEYLRKKMRDLPEPDPAKSAESRIVLAKALYSYAVAFHGLGAFEDAGRHFAMCHEIGLAELGETDERTLRAALGIGACEIELGRHEEARAILERTLALVREHHPEDTGLIQTIQGNLGVLHAETGDREKALELAEIAFAAVEKEGVAKEDEEYLRALQNLAHALAAVGRTEEALARLESLLSILEGVRPKSRWKERIERLEKTRKRWLEKPPPPPAPPPSAPAGEKPPVPPAGEEGAFSPPAVLLSEPDALLT